MYALARIQLNIYLYVEKKWVLQLNLLTETKQKTRVYPGISQSYIVGMAKVMNDSNLDLSTFGTSS